MLKNVLSLLYFLNGCIDHNQTCTEKSFGDGNDQMKVALTSFSRSLEVKRSNDVKNVEKNALSSSPEGID